MTLTNNIVSYWTLDEVSGNRADSVGSNTLVDTNTVASTTGLISNAADFVAANSESLVAPDMLGGATFALSWWVNPDRVNATECMLHKSTEDATGDSTGAEYRVLMLDSGNVQYGVGNGTGWVGGSVAHGMSAGTWYHFVLQYTGTVVELYKNASLLASNTSTFTPKNSVGSLHWGKRVRNITDLYFDGQMDEMGAWSRHLTTTEISRLYNGGLGLTYPFGIYTLELAQGSFALTGQTVALNRLYNLVMAAGSYVLTGIDAALSALIHWKYPTKSTTTYDSDVKNTTTYSSPTKNTDGDNYVSKS